MNDKTIHPLTQNVLDTFADCTDPRLKQIMTALVTHLHAFASEVELTGDEWRRGIEFLTATGKMCNGIRQEFILLSDTLGLSIMIDAINHGRGGVTTDSSLLGPFYREGAKEEEFGANIARTEGEPTLIHGRLVDEGGAPVAGALIEWKRRTTACMKARIPISPRATCAVNSARGRTANTHSGPSNRPAIRFRPTALSDRC
jgi:catechol 1,2-dioxygenase